MKKGLKIFFALFLLSFLVGCAYAGDENSTEIIEVQDKELIESTNTTESVLNSEKDDKLSLSSDQENIIEKSNNKSDITKKNLKIKTDSNFVKKGNNYYICLVDENGKAIANKDLTITFNGNKIEKTTASSGKVAVKVSLSSSYTMMNISFSGDDEYKPFSKVIKVYIEKSIKISIGNKKLLTNGYLRIYLSGPEKSIAYKTIKIKIGNKVFTRKTTKEGFVVVKPKMGKGKYTVTVTYGNYNLKKRISCIAGSPINPLRKSVPTVNGAPDIDRLHACFIMADNDAKYTLKKSQYRQVLKRDSYSLYLYGKLTKYTFFKTKESPKIYHVIKREKWNVIERTLNIKLVKKNKYNYWPSTITASLKGKSYTYSEVRDVQNTEYTCGPTSASVCSQALRNYYSEKFFQIKAHVTDGVNIPVLKSVLNRYNFRADYYYTDSFNSALNQLKNGGAALIAFLPNHYVSVIDISNNGEKILVSNSYGEYNVGGNSKVPTNWVSVKYFKSKFAGVGLVVKLKYKLSKNKKAEMKNFYKSMGPKWPRQNVFERIINT